MRKELLSALALVILVLACAGEAGALVQRTFVSGLGSDTNPCSRTQPCRTFEAAIAQTQPGGEVIALDSAGYGPVAITKAISLISPPGVYAGITTTTPGTNAITINAGATDRIVLQGLSLSGLGLGEYGVRFESGRTLDVDGLTISGFNGSGIAVVVTARATVAVTDSVIRFNGREGIYAAGAPFQRAFVTVERTRLLDSDDGLIAAAHSRVSVRESVANGNDFSGFWADGDAQLELEDCLATHNNVGIRSETLAFVRVAGTTVNHNSEGLAAEFGASIFTRGNNTVEGNDVNGTFTGLFAAK